ncbi:hypothetical protein M8J75_016523 [Diaphorina citri]|nr:hypothetical protein M8J75_016523 [Diaphorina citri]
MQSQLVILGLSVLWGAWLSPSVRGELIGPNVCTRNETFTTIVRVSETVPYQKREIVWCSSVPPKRSVSKMGYRQVYKNDTITQTRLVEECCKGYMLSPAGNRCVPVCTDECIRGTCIAPNTCKCEVGFGGPTCNIECPEGHYGPDCKLACQCENGAGCDPNTGACDCLDGYMGTHCEEVCGPGRFGQNCSQECQCRNGAECHPATGECSCQPGFTGSLCEERCPPGTHGPSCINRCRCQNGAICNPANGQCLCAPGWMGSCMDPCPEGTWGKQCVHYCSCPVESMECSRIDGNCSCPPGFRGAKCKERTCPDGLYGEGCDRTCECNVENTKLCHAVTGKCECGPGWDGLTCDRPCPITRWGDNCSQHCNCKNDALCFPHNGTCLCPAGFSGRHCEKPCPQGSYGQDCSQTCLCSKEGSASCSPDSGQCVCKPGWAGQLCDRPCSEGRYGQNCTQECRCMNGAACNPQDGTCLCPAGYYGPLCQKRCEFMTYGRNCAQACTCFTENSQGCDIVTGKCICRPGFKGHRCETQCSNPNTYGEDCSLDCGCNNGGTCNQLDGGCNCGRGYQGKLCTAPCPEGQYGYNCKEECLTKGQGNKTCDHVTGELSCPAGYEGPTCQQPCPLNHWGKGCTQQCACKNGADCHHVTGVCQCLPGRTGKNCGQPCPEGTYGYQCSQICKCQNGGKCRLNDGECRLCPESYYGDHCMKQCDCINENFVCHPVKGCVCKQGFMGPRCDEPRISELVRPGRRSVIKNIKKMPVLLESKGNCVHTPVITSVLECPVDSYSAIILPSHQNVFSSSENVTNISQESLSDERQPIPNTSPAPDILDDSTFSFTPVREDLPNVPPNLVNANGCKSHPTPKLPLDYPNSLPSDQVTSNNHLHKLLPSLAPAIEDLPSVFLTTTGNADDHISPARSDTSDHQNTPSHDQAYQAISNILLTPVIPNDNDSILSVTTSTIENPCNISPATNIISDDPASNDTSEIIDHRPREKCPYCMGHYVAGTGLQIHINSAHPAESRAQREQRYILPRPDSQTHTDIDSETDSQQSTVTSADQRKIQSQLANLAKTFENMLSSPLDEVLLQEKCLELHKVLREAILVLPGPKHPATKHFEKRQKAKNQTSITMRQSQNPARKSKAERDRRKAKYNYEVAQFMYYNRRKHVVRKITDGNKAINSNKLETEILQSYFSDKLSNPNDKCREHYPNVPQDQSTVTITKDDVIEEIKKVNFDSSAGPDGVIPRAIKNTPCEQAIANLSNVILKFSVLPPCLCQGRTVLIFKDGDPSDPKNYRPITIFPLVRRIIEKCLEKKLKWFTSTAPEQRGFKNGPGTHINASLVNGCLRDAKSKKKEICVVFLDVSKAFDTVGHKHIEKTLLSSGAPSCLTNALLACVNNNSTKIENQMEKTATIDIKRGVAQGAPTSPILFSLAIDHIIREQNESSIKEAYGYEVTPSEQLSLLAFADDLAVIAKNKEAASAIINAVDMRLAEIGLSMNPSKSQGIHISKGKLNGTGVYTTRGCIKTITNNTETIRYLGTNFSDEIYLDTPNLIKLDESNTPLLSTLRSCDIEISSACNTLDTSPSESVKKMREALREREFEAWEKMALRGLGVCVYKEVPMSNKWVYDKQILSSSEWTTALKMSANIAGVRAIPGRNTGTTLCRQPGCAEKETLSHVLGSCHKNELLRNTRHHTVRSSIANELRHLGWTVDEEISCISEDSSTRRCDIVAVNTKKSQAIILDPTVRKRVKDLKTEIVENQTVHYNRNVSPDPTHFENPAYSFSPSPGYAPDGACALPGSYPNNMINNFNQPRTKLNNLERERSLDCDSDSYRSSNYSVSLRKNREADRHNPNLYNSIEDFKEHLYDEIPGKPTLPEDSYDHLDHRRPATSLKPHYHRTANGGVKGSQELLAAHIDTDFGGPSIPNGNSPPAVPAGNPARLAGPGAYENSTTPGGNSASSTQDFGRNSTSSADFGRMKAELESLGDRRGSTGNEL